MTTRAIEFYSGIGGLHRALELSNIDGTVVRAFDWDQTARQVYEANYGSGLVEKTDISTLTAGDILRLEAQLWLMSPSCQPYTVLNPSAKGGDDPRAKSFLHIMRNVLPDLVKAGGGPRWVLIENVAGFEGSTTRQEVLEVLGTNGYDMVELLLTPLQYGIPNSRLRYYLLAKARPKKFAGGAGRRGTHVWRHIPGDAEFKSEDEQQITLLTRYLDQDRQGRDFDLLRIPDRVLEKWGRLFDIVLPGSRRTCCFTRGSILQTNEELDTTEVFDRFLAAQKDGFATSTAQSAASVSILHPLGLRYFSPPELLRIFHFESFENEEGALDSSNPAFIWPPGLSLKSKYRLLGNSVNVEVVRRLINYLFEGVC